MAISQAKASIFIHLSVLLLSSFSVLGHENNGGIVSWALAPHTLPSLLSPAPAPKPHKGHHHPHTPPATLSPPPSAAPPAHSPPPATPPTHSSPPPAKAPTPPPKANTTPPAKPPTHHHHHHSSPVPVKPPTASPPVKPPSPPIQRKAIVVRGLVYCKSCKYRGVDNLYKATPLEGAVVKLACNNTKYHLVEKTKTDKNGFFLIMPKTVTSAGFHKCKVFLVASPKKECGVFTNYKLGLAGAPLIPTPPPPELKSPPYVLFTVGPFAFEPSKKAPCPLLKISS